MKNYWKRFSLYDKGLAAFFIINLFLDVINHCCPTKLKMWY